MRQKERVTGRAWPLMLPWMLGVVLFVGPLWVYARTAAPSVMSGDSAEFQFAAPLGGVPHPTGYPLYMLLGRLATLGNPSDIAHRVTLLSSLLAAATVALGALFVLRLTGRALAALIAGLALAVAPGLWNAATIAEVYALNVLLLMLLTWALVKANTEGPQQRRWQLVAAFVTGLGFSHHGSFVFTGVPLFLGCGVWWLWQTLQQARQNEETVPSRILALVGGCFLAGVIGLSPWAYPFIQYARYGPFIGLDHGLPRHYFWGSPTSWSDVVNHLLGGAIRGGIFRIPDTETAYRALRVLLGRLRFEYGTVGGMLGAIGFVLLFWRNRGVWLATTWIAGATSLYFLLLGHAVQDAIIFTLPLLLPWALWIGIAVAAIEEWRVPAGIWRLPARQLHVAHLPQRVDDERAGVVRLLNNPLRIVQRLLILLLLVWTVRWGYSRMPYGNKADQWLFRTFGEGVLTRLEPSAVVVSRWEQGTILQYLHLVEHQRPDITVDIVEPEDVPWGERIAQRYNGRPVYIIGSDADAAGVGAQPVWGTDYAQLYQLRR